MADGNLIVYITRWCPDCRRTTQYLSAQNIPYKIINIDQDPVGERFVRQANGGFKSVPTILFPDGSLLVEPALETLAEKINSLKI